jgi:hypothetical protein
MTTAILPANCFISCILFPRRLCGRGLYMKTFNETLGAHSAFNRRQFAAEATMSSFQYVDQAGRPTTTATASWQRSVFGIAALSALSWAVVILIVIAALSAL